MRFGSIRIIRTSSGVDRNRIDVSIVLMQPDFPDPVVPAIRRCGMRARSVHTAVPEMSLPSQTASGDAVAGRSSKMSPSVTRFGWRFGSSTPTACFPGLAVTGFGLVTTLGSGHGGAIGRGLGELFGLLLGTTGTTILGVFALVVGALLLSGASIGAFVRRSGHAVRRAHSRARRARTHELLTDSAPVVQLRPPEQPVDAVHDYPDVVGD